MPIKYFVEEEDAGNLGSPLFSFAEHVRAGRPVFNCYSDADKLADEWSKAGIPFQVWKIDTETEKTEWVSQ